MRYRILVTTWIVKASGVSGYAAAAVSSLVIEFETEYEASRAVAKINDAKHYGAECSQKAVML